MGGFCVGTWVGWKSDARPNPAVGAEESICWGDGMMAIGILEIYIGERRGVPLILTPTPQGMLEVAVLDRPVFRVAYVSPDEAATDAGVGRAKAELQSAHPFLFVGMPSIDGPPNRSGVIFRYEQDSQMPWRDGMHAKQVNVQRYLAACTLSLYSWGSDLLRGKPGFFLFGTQGAKDLWRIARVESDFAGRQLFTLSPVQHATGIPKLDLSKIENPLLREKLERDWNDLQRCFSQQIYSGLITSAKNVAEDLALFAIGKSGSASTLSLDQSLKQLRKALEDKQPTALPLSFLDYHLMSKLRILHGHTHTDRVLIEGRLVDPEFALSVLPDIIQILRSAGLTQGAK